MRHATSPSTTCPYGVARVCRVWRIPRSNFYDLRRRGQACQPQPVRKRGPIGAGTDAEIADHIRRILEESPWVGEGHRKAWARLRFKGIRTARRRVLRIMREEGLLAPTRLGRVRGPIHHDGSIIPDAPNELWGTDATGTLTDEGQATIFLVVDHCTAECIGLHAARPGTRFEALEPLRHGVREHFGGFDQNVAVGLQLRHDHGSQFISHAYQEELRFLGIESSPAYVRQPEGNGCAERFIRTLKEQLLWLRRFATVSKLNSALKEFMHKYNNEWLIERHGWRSPKEQRCAMLASQGDAA